MEISSRFEREKIPLKIEKSTIFAIISAVVVVAFIVLKRSAIISHPTKCHARWQNVKKKLHQTVIRATVRISIVYHLCAVYRGSKRENPNSIFRPVLLCIYRQSIPLRVHTESLNVCCVYDGIFCFGLALLLFPPSQYECMGPSHLLCYLVCVCSHPLVYSTLNFTIYVT